MPRRRPSIPLIVALVLVVAVLLFTAFQDRLAANALRQVAQMAEEGGHRITFGDVHLSIWSKHISISDLAVVPLVDTTREDSASRYTVHADRLDLRGVDLLALLWNKVLHVGTIELNGPSVSHSFVTGQSTPSKEAGPEHERQEQMPLEMLRVDTLRITDATGSAQDRSQREPALKVGDLDLFITGIRLVLDAEGMPVTRLDGIAMDLREVRTHLQPFYTLTLDSAHIRVPQDSAIFFGVRFTPDVTPKAYHKHVQEQVELYQASVDTLLLRGFDLAQRLSTGTLRAREVYAAGVALNIHRDKSLPRAAPQHKPLLADRIADMKLPLQVDSIFIQRGSVTYHERLTRDADYGSIAFSHIDAVVTGLGNLAQENPPDLYLRGSTHLGHGRARVEMSMPVGQDRTTLNVHVVLTGFPASDMNRMTDDLLHVKATRGTIHRVEMRMQGDNHRASGSIDMHYDSLVMELGTRVKHAKVLSALANLVVRGSNMPGTKGYRKAQFSVDKPIEAGVFKYIWISLREGMLEVVLPPMMQKQLHKHQARKKSQVQAGATQRK